MMNEQSELDELNRVLGRRLAGIRREAGLTQAQLAARLRGTTSVMQNGYVVQTFTRGTGPSKTTFRTGYWSAAGS
jgi:hypothetical protein